MVEGKQAEEQKEKVQERKTQPEQRAAEAGAEKKRKKVNRLSLKEVEKRLKEVQEKMGGLSSIYARHLLKRKEQLLVMTRKKEVAEAPKSGGEDAEDAQRSAE